jgi:anti-sigma-K factor RskA
MSEARDQISSYLLGELEPAEASAFERRLAEDPALHAEVDGLRPVVARLEQLPEEAWAPPEPPPLQMPADAVEEPAPKPRRARHSWLSGALTLRPAAAGGLAALLLAIGIATGLLIGGGESVGSEDGGPDLVLSRIDDGPAGAHGDVLLGGDEQRASVELAGLDPTGPDDFYELWLLDDDGRMIALGSFPVGEDGQAEVDLPLPVEPSRYRYFDVSLQEDNGDPAHSGVSVLRGPTSS